MVPANAHCLDCHYPLAGTLDSRCPECGRAFEPNEPASFWTPDRRYLTKLSRPPGAVFLGAVSLWAFVALVMMSSPVWNLLLFLPVLGGMGILGTTWILKCVAALSTSTPLPQRMSRANALRRWLTAPALVLFLFLASATSLPARIRFELGRSSLDAAAVRAREGSAVPPGRIGLYNVRLVQLRGGHVILILDGAPFSSDLSVLVNSADYLPPDSLLNSDAIECGVHFGGRWHGGRQIF